MLFTARKVTELSSKDMDGNTYLLYFQEVDFSKQNTWQQIASFKAYFVTVLKALFKLTGGEKCTW